MFLLKKSCCWWSGQSWPYATTPDAQGDGQPAAGLRAERRHAGRLRQAARRPTRRRTARTASRTSPRRCHPDTGSFEGHDGYNHSEHYFHSAFNDLVITGLVGLRPRDDDTLEVNPLAPADWDYFALDDVPYRGPLGRASSGTATARATSGARGCGCSPTARRSPSSRQARAADGQAAAAQADAAGRGRRAVNFAVNNDGDLLPARRPRRTRTRKTSPAKLDRRQLLVSLATRRTAGPARARRTPATRSTIDFGTKRPIDTVEALLPRRRQGGRRARRGSTSRCWDGKDVEADSRPDALAREADRPPGQRDPLPGDRRSQKLRAVLHHADGGQVRADRVRGVGRRRRCRSPPPPHPAGNLAYNPGDKPFPKATASHSDRFGGKPELAIDGKVELPADARRTAGRATSRPTRPTGWRSTSAAAKAFAPGRAGDLRRPRRGAAADQVRGRSTGTATAGSRWPTRRSRPRSRPGVSFNEVRFDRGDGGQGARRVHPRGQGPQRGERDLRLE